MADSMDLLAKKIADLYKQNRNPPSTAPRVGTVLEASPLKIQWGDNVLLTEDKLFVPRTFRDGYIIPYRWQDTNGNMVDDETIFKVSLDPGDKVIIIPDEYLKMWYIVEKLN